MKQSRHVEVSHRRARGFSMVEVLVSLIIIAVGMLGLAKMQALAYASTGVASQQSIAALEAASLASAMRANRNYWSTLTTNFSYVAAGTIPPTITTTDATLTGTYACAFGGANAPCTAGQIAATDLQAWFSGLTGLNTVLPNPKATITCPPQVAGTPVGCWITVTWFEENVAVNSNAVGQTISSPAYTLYVVP